MKHIFVIDIEIKETTDDNIVLRCLDRMNKIKPGNYSDRCDVEEEQVRAKKFMNKNGDAVWVGISKKVQQVLGLPFEAFENMEKTVNDLQRIIEHKDKKHLETVTSFISMEDRYKTASFWQRLRYLFTKKITTQGV
ncbi:MAG: hypothetical protein GY845_25770 [Planctomycetes bacterium]|nr:hypothetical protein [Planctomycetota bacterium]